MKRMNLRDVPDDVYAVLVAAAEGSRQSLSAFVVDRLSEVAQAVRVADYVATYPAPRGTGVTAEDAVARYGKCARRRERGGHRRVSPDIASISCRPPASSP
jgi:hypothetical protein